MANTAEDAERTRHTQYYKDITRIRRQAADEKRLASKFFAKSEHCREKSQKFTAKAVALREKIERVKEKSKKIDEKISSLRQELAATQEGSKKEAVKLAIAKQEHKHSKQKLKADAIEAKAAKCIDKSAALREKGAKFLQESHSHESESGELTKRADRLEQVDAEQKAPPPEQQVADSVVQD